MDDDFELLDRLESGSCSDEDMAAGLALASQLTDDDMLYCDVFAGDESDVRVIDRRVVKGRVSHTDHYTGFAIQPGARQLVLREMCEGEFLTTRHSELSLWMLTEGFDPSMLRKKEG